MAGYTCHYITFSIFVFSIHKMQIKREQTQKCVRKRKMTFILKHRQMNDPNKPVLEISSVRE